MPPKPASNTVRLSRSPSPASSAALSSLACPFRGESDRSAFSPRAVKDRPWPLVMFHRDPSLLMLSKCTSSCDPSLCRQGPCVRNLLYGCPGASIALLGTAWIKVGPENGWQETRPRAPRKRAKKGTQCGEQDRNATDLGADQGETSELDRAVPGELDGFKGDVRPAEATVDRASDVLHHCGAACLQEMASSNHECCLLEGGRLTGSSARGRSLRSKGQRRLSRKPGRRRYRCELRSGEGSLGAGVSRAARAAGRPTLPPEPPMHTLRWTRMLAVTWTQEP